MSVKHSIRIFFIFIIALVYTGSLTAQEKAYPKNGEGITLFLKRFNRTGGTYQKEFIELNKGKLGKNNSLRMGVKYTLPPLASAPQKKNYQPLFGKSLASYIITSSDLKQRYILSSKTQRTEYVTSNSSITANGKLVWVVRSPSAK